MKQHKESAPVRRPDYVVNVVKEDDVTVDWFFGDRPFPQKIVQLVLVIIGWFFAILPIVVTASALIHRNDAGGWWNYREGFVMWDVTIDILGLLAAAFVIGFLALHLINRYAAKRHNREITYDQERLDLRLGLADDLYATKYGTADLRVLQRNIIIEPYGDIETYELRDIYRTYGVA